MHVHRLFQIQKKAYSFTEFDQVIISYRIEKETILTLSNLFRFTFCAELKCKQKAYSNHLDSPFQSCTANVCRARPIEAYTHTHTRHEISVCSFSRWWISLARMRIHLRNHQQMLLLGVILLWRFACKCCRCCWWCCWCGDGSDTSWVVGGGDGGVIVAEPRIKKPIQNWNMLSEFNLLLLSVSNRDDTEKKYFAKQFSW